MNGKKNIDSAILSDENLTTKIILEKLIANQHSTHIPHKSIFCQFLFKFWAKSAVYWLVNENLSDKFGQISTKKTHVRNVR